jgi:cell division protein FtsA
LGAGLVLTGGGAKLGGLVAVAEEMFALPVRVGIPTGLAEMGETLPDPAFATVVGLVIHGYRVRLLRDPHPSAGLLGKLWNSLRGKN